MLLHELSMTFIISSFLFLSEHQLKIAARPWRVVKHDASVLYHLPFFVSEQIAEGFIRSFTTIASCLSSPNIGRSSTRDTSPASPSILPRWATAQLAKWFPGCVEGVSVATNGHTLAPKLIFSRKMFFFAPILPSKGKKYPVFAYFHCCSYAELWAKN